MDSIDSAAAAATAPAVRRERPPRIWKFWGTALWGLLAFVAMFAGQFVLVAVLFVAKGPPFDMDSIKAVASNGTVISLSVMMGLPAVLMVLWLATRLAGTPFTDYLALRRTSWLNLLIGVSGLIVLIAAWDLLGRVLARDATPGFMLDVLKSAQADGAIWLLVIAFAVAAPVTEELMVRGFLYRGWSESFPRPVGAIVLSSLVWTAMHVQYYDLFLFGEVASIGFLLGYMRYRGNSTWLTIIMHGVNNLAATVQSIWLVNS
jgi:uncharacterized protein